LRLGPIPLAKNAICAINEIGSMNFEDQRFLLDIMEEGRFTIDKYGIHQEIDSPTTIKQSHT
jgi:replicative DNA helicase Mcm